jgi:hypothetical protein|tara:strand:+ start:513 stop:1073 length:561 start_codon:yes stop_codon:yes gene_type:complete
MKRDFSLLLWMFASPRETRDIIRLNLHEAGLLYKYASQQSGNIILEIGRYWAGTLMLLAIATHDSKVKIISIDGIEGCHDPDVDDWLNDYEEKERIDIKVGNSHAMENVPLSMLFVDGDHSYEGVKKDFIHHWNYLNGPCLAHDYTDPTCEGVTKFIDEWVEEGYAEIIEQVQTMVALKKLKDYEV